MRELRRKLKSTKIILFISIMLFFPTWALADVALTTEGKVPGKPFVFLQEQIDDLVNALAAETAAREAADAAESAARNAADAALQTQITNNAGSAATAHTNLQNNIDAEASARAAADTGLQSTNTNNIDANAAAIATNAGSIGGETAARIAADTELLSGPVLPNITANAGDISTNMDAIALNTNEITDGTASPAHDDSRIDDLDETMGQELVVSIMHTDDGALSSGDTSSSSVDGAHFPRQDLFNLDTGLHKFRAELAHGLDKSSTIWWCRVGYSQVSAIHQWHWRQQDDDFELIDGLPHSSWPKSEWWWYKLDNIYHCDTNGENCLSPFQRILVKDNTLKTTTGGDCTPNRSEACYREVIPTATHPVDGYIWGFRDFDEANFSRGMGANGSINVGVSHAQIHALAEATKAASGPGSGSLPSGDDDVVVDLTEVQYNTKVYPAGVSGGGRVAGQPRQLDTNRHMFPTTAPFLP